jgi:hypothetical protein
MSRAPRRQPARTSQKRAGPPSLGKHRLDELVEEAIIDAYGESEQLVGLLCTLQQHLALPFTTQILGIPVRVERVDVTDADEIVAICRRGPLRQKVSVLDLPLPSPPPDGWEWIAAYRHWARGRR